MSDTEVSIIDPLSKEQRTIVMDAKRPRRDLPVVGQSAKHRAIPLLDESREVDREYRPIYAVWEITLACDLACRHCGSRAGHARPDELTTSECFDLVDQLADLGVMEVSLIGGEAYLRDDFYEIVKRIRSRGMIPLLTTGARGINRERAFAIAQAGVASVSISIDGNEATHNRLRGVSDSYTKALQAFDYLREAKVKVSANTQINRLSMPELLDVLEVITEKRVHSWQIQLTVAMGRAADEPDVLLQPYDMLTLFPLLGAIKKKCNERKMVLWVGNNIGYFGPFETDLRGSWPTGHMGACSAGRGGIGIESDGTIKGCPSLNTENWAAGNIREHKLAEIWERSKPLRFTRDRTVDGLWGYCKTCYYAEECLAGCTWTAEALFGKPGNNPWCHHRALEFAEKGLRERLVQVQSAKGEPFDQGRFEIIVEAMK